MFLHTNDQHGSLQPYNYEEYEVIGLAERAFIIKSIKSVNENIIILDAGDINTGQFESLYFQAKPDIEAYNNIGYDAFTLGNHEFYYGLEHLKTQMSWAQFPFLCANIMYPDSTYITHPYIIKNMPNGLKVGIIGLTTSAKLYPIAEEIGIVVYDEIEVAQSIIPDLRKQVDIVIVLTHMGFMEPFPFGSIRLANEVQGIDIIIDGDSHSFIEEPLIVKGTPIVQAGDRGKYLGKGILYHDIETKNVSLKEWIYIPLMRQNDGVLAFETDPETSEIIKSYTDKLSEYKKIIANTNDDFTSTDIRNKQTSLGRMIGDAILSSVQKFSPDFAITNSGGIRASLPKGDITNIDIENMYPFDNNIVVISLTGADIIQIINKSVMEQKGTGGYLQFSSNLSFLSSEGLVFGAMLNGFQIKPGSKYKVAVCSYLATGGDGYEIIAKAEVLSDVDLQISDAIIEYLMMKYPVRK